MAPVEQTSQTSRIATDALLSVGSGVWFRVGGKEDAMI